MRHGAGRRTWRDAKEQLDRPALPRPRVCRRPPRCRGRPGAVLRRRACLHLRGRLGCGAGRLAAVLGGAAAVRRAHRPVAHALAVAGRHPAQRRRHRGERTERLLRAHTRVRGGVGSRRRRLPPGIGPRRPDRRPWQPSGHGLVLHRREHRLRARPADGRNRGGCRRTAQDAAPGAPRPRRRRDVPARGARPAAGAGGRPAHGAAHRERRRPLLPETVPGRGLPVDRVRRPEHLHLAVRPAAAGRQRGRGNRGPVRVLPRRCGRLGAGRFPREPLGPREGLSLLVRAHGGGGHGCRVGAGPGDPRLRRAGLRRPVRPLLAAGDARPGLPALPGRHGERDHPGPDRQHRRPRRTRPRCSRRRHVPADRPRTPCPDAPTELAAVPRSARTGRPEGERSWRPAPAPPRAARPFRAAGGAR